MAMELGVDIGSYTHIAGSLHLYERDSQLRKEEASDISTESNKKNHAEG